MPRFKLLNQNLSPFLGKVRFIRPKYESYKNGDQRRDQGVFTNSEMDYHDQSYTWISCNCGSDKQSPSPFQGEGLG
jgi:hypothetical protein